MLEKIKNAGIKMARIIKKVVVTTCHAVASFVKGYVEFVGEFISDTVRVAQENPVWFRAAALSVAGILIGDVVSARHQQRKAYSEGGNAAIHDILVKINNEMEPDVPWRLTDAPKYADANGTRLSTLLVRRAAQPEEA